LARAIASGLPREPVDAEPPRRGRLLSLRTKLTLWFLLLFGAIQCAITGAAVLVRQRVTERSLDAQLLACGEAIARRLAVAQPRWVWTRKYLEAAIPMDVDFEIVVVRDADGADVVSTGHVDPQGLPAVTRESARDPPALATIARAAGTGPPLRVLTAPFQSSGGETYVIQAGATTRSIPSPGLDLLIVGGPISLFAAGVVAWLLAGRAVAPMKVLSEAVRTLAPERIAARVAVPHAEHEVARLQADLNQALERLEAGYRAQERFISNVAHDLKTPIAVMLSASQVLDPQSSTRAEYESYRKSVQEEMCHLGALLESFLTLARADQGGALPRRELVAINDVVVESISRCKPEARHYRVRLVPRIIPPGDGGEAELMGDPGLLCTMLDNLVRNAIRFSPARGTVDVRAAVAGPEAVITVRDRGPGIPEDFLGRIFERFVQAPQDEARAKGTGLGLTIARTVAELHGGTIRARNVDDGGCEFEVRLALQGVPAAEPDESVPVRPVGEVHVLAETGRG
jgi:signal transduction histidine kinase